jgi:uncharacterized protein (DUF983 family)
MEPSVLKAAILGRCPRCGRGKLFDGYLAVRSRCACCNLDYSVFDPGDGPAVFVVLIAGGIVTASALWVESSFHPAYWVHAVLWLPLIGLLTIALLRMIKGLLLVLQYKHRSGEGKLEDTAESSKGHGGPTDG